MLNDNLKAVHYPGYSAVNTLNNVKNEKFNYDEKAKYKLEEGEYYIFGNKINKFKAGIFNFITRDTDKVGERYIQIHKNLKGDITEFSAEDEKMLIHGGINYEDKGGIDLSTGADEFFKDLEYIVKEKYHDKLYKVAGNIPIRLIEKYNRLIPDIAWGKHVDIHFKMKVIEICEELEINPDYLMACMAFETGRTFRADKKNPLSSATGLIQFMETTAKKLGTTTLALSQMTEVEQLDYVKQYFISSKGKLKTLEDVYMKILWPNAVGKEEDSIVFDRYGKTDEEYLANAGLDLNKDNKITKKEISSKVRSILEEGLKENNKG